MNQQNQQPDQTDQTAQDASENTGEQNDSANTDDQTEPELLDMGAGSESGDREAAQRVLAREFADATYNFKESEDDRAPNYVLLPTGAKANRVFFVGTLAETEDVGKQDSYWRGKIVDPTGSFWVYAGQWQQEAANFLRDAEAPMYVAVLGKPKLYETDDGSINLSIRPEQITEVDETTRNRWVADAASQTLERLKAFDAENNPYAELATREYDLDLTEYTESVAEAGHGL